jgi:GPH family glycoside/pentoside/hexuronide:cation symporter
MLVYLGLGMATIAHQSWGAALTQAPGERARVGGVREACGLAGVVLAAGVTGAAGYRGLTSGLSLAVRVLPCCSSARHAAVGGAAPATPLAPRAAR